MSAAQRAQQSRRAPSTASKQCKQVGHQAQQASMAGTQHSKQATQHSEPNGGPRLAVETGRERGSNRCPQSRRSESDQLRATQGSAGRLLPPRATVPRRRPDELRAAGKIAGRRTCQPAVVRAARCARQPERASARAGGRGRPARLAAWSYWTARQRAASRPKR